MAPTRSTGFTIWLTGLSGAGKSTLAEAVRTRLVADGLRVEGTDGDELRRHFNADLGFAESDRHTNVRRIGFVAGLLARNDVAVIVAAISPFRALRDEVRAQHDTPFIEVFVDCPLDVLVERDVKGLYRKAMAGHLEQFTGISAVYEPPVSPDVHVRTDVNAVSACVNQILAGVTRNRVS